ncbi:MAG: carboxymuconolactone decarboxylase family protein [Actinomycetota bacterium]|nr:carboxymuconolactone decarboxylase family protein [Actinomycetota bacterium]
MKVKLTKNEALLTLGIAATVGCDGCIEHHVEDAVVAGATQEEVQETIELARRIGGKPSAHCCDEAMEALDEVSGVPI